MYVAQRFCRHLCEVNCLSDGSTAPIKSIAVRGAKSVRKEGGRGWRRMARYGLSCLETHELGKSSFQFDSAPLSFSLTPSPFRWLYAKAVSSLWKAQPALSRLLPFETTTPRLFSSIVRPNDARDKSLGSFVRTPRLAKVEWQSTSLWGNVIKHVYKTSPYRVYKSNLLDQFKIDFSRHRKCRENNHFSIKSDREWN